MRKPTIYEALRDKLGREPTNAELKADVERILTESMVERATSGKLRPPVRRPRRRAPAPAPYCGKPMDVGKCGEDPIGIGGAQVCDECYQRLRAEGGA